MIAQTQYHILHCILSKRMKLAGILFFILISPNCFSQLGINFGLKAGVNFVNVTRTSGVDISDRRGYLLGGYIAPKPKKLVSFRSEFILSRQGYNYSTGSSSGNVDLDYLLLPQLLTINFTKFVQVHLGGQAAFLLNADVDSTGNGDSGSLLDYFNRFDYSLVAGAELFPLRKWLFVGARINVGLNNLSENGSGPNFIPGVDAKNNVVQIYAGIRL